MSTPIEELTALVDALRAETTEQSITPERIGAILQRMIDVLPSVADANSLKGWVAISSINELPSNPSPSQRALAYLLDTTLYVYVGSGGDTLEGKYCSAELKGASGDRGIGFDSVLPHSPVDGAFDIVLSNGDVLTLDLKHNHDTVISTGEINRLKFHVCEDETEYTGITTKDANTLYLIPEDAS